MTKAVIERALQADMTHELGYEHGDPAGAGSGNSRNGSARETIATANGPVTIAVPRDRNGTFEPKIVPKRARRLGQIDEMILSLYARGLSTRDIEAHLLEVYGRSHLEQISDRISGLLDPIAVAHRGWPAETIAPILARAWHREFHGRLGQVALSDTAAAIRDGRPWSEALWPRCAGWPGTPWTTPRRRS